jgi:hypothetical protein
MAPSVVKASTIFLLLATKNVFAFNRVDLVRSNRIHVCGKAVNFNKVCLSSSDTTIKEDFVDEMDGEVAQAACIESVVEVKSDLPIFSRVSRAVGNSVKFDKAKIAKLGMTFALTYHIVSNINGSISFSLAWYIASSRVSILSIFILMLFGNLLLMFCSF